MCMCMYVCVCGVVSVYTCVYVCVCVWCGERVHMCVCVCVFRMVFTSHTESRDRVGWGEGEVEEGQE